MFISLTLLLITLFLMMSLDLMKSLIFLVVPPVGYPPLPWYRSREGVIIECPLNGQYHDRRDVILTSQMAVSNNFKTVIVIQNI